MDIGNQLASSESGSGLSDWGRLPYEIAELIFSFLPIRSIVRAGAVCKLWRSVVSQSSFSSRIYCEKKPWFFLCGQSNTISKNNQGFGYDPEADEWVRLPTSLFPRPTQEENFTGSGGFFFTTNSSTCSRFSYAPVLGGTWRETPPLKFSRYNPLVGVFGECSRIGFKFIVVGGVRFIGGLVDIEDRLAVEIYDPQSETWELCSPLPADFGQANSSQWLSSTIFRGKFFVFGIYSGFISWFDLGFRAWSGVQTLRPPWALFSFLIACNNRLVLAGVSTTSSAPMFKLWWVDDRTLEPSEAGSMPEDLLGCLCEADDLASLKCVGLGDLIYVFNEAPHRSYPACLCEFTSSNRCKWRKLPEIPAPVNRFHKMRWNSLLPRTPRSSSRRRRRLPCSPFCNPSPFC